jgi:DNA-binding CsgD family transcriptional regulator
MVTKTQDRDRPYVLVGRRPLLDAVTRDLQADPTGGPVLVTGQRGSGRRAFTVAVARRCRRAGWTVHQLAPERSTATSSSSDERTRPGPKTASAAEADMADIGPWPLWLDHAADQLAAAAERSPVLVVLRDLDHTEVSALERCWLLDRRLVGRQVRLLISVRVPEPTMPAGPALTRLAAVAARYRLEPLGDDDVRLLAHQLLDTPVSAAFVTMLNERLGAARGRPEGLSCLLRVVRDEDLAVTIDGELQPTAALQRAGFPPGHPWVAAHGLDHPAVRDLVHAVHRHGPLPARVLGRVGALRSTPLSKVHAIIDMLCSGSVLSQDPQAQVGSAMPALTAAVRPMSAPGRIGQVVADALAEDLQAGRRCDLTVLAGALLASQEYSDGDARQRLTKCLTDPEVAKAPEAAAVARRLLGDPSGAEGIDAELDLLARAAVRAVHTGRLDAVGLLQEDYVRLARTAPRQLHRDLDVQRAGLAARRGAGEPDEATARVPMTPMARRFLGATMAWQEGRWDDALQIAVEGLVRTAWEDDPLHTCGLRAVAVEILAQRGEHARAQALTGGWDVAASTERWTDGPVQCVIACTALGIAVRGGHGPIALASLMNGLARREPARLPEGADRLLVLMVEAALAAGDANTAGAVRAILAQLAVARGGRVSAAERYATAAVDRDLASAREAVGLAAQDGALYPHALTLLLAARLDESAVDLLGQAHELFGRLRAVGPRAQAARLMRERSIPVPRVRRGPADGDQARDQLVQLVTAGLTNRQVAARLCVSEKTVERRLSVVLAEEGCRSRVELAARYSRTANA